MIWTTLNAIAALMVFATLTTLIVMSFLAMAEAICEDDKWK